MFGWFRVKKEPQSPAEVRLEEIKNILFPPLELREGVDGSETFKYHIDHSVDSNLDSALTDIESGYADQVVAKTVKDAILRLVEVRKKLDAFAEFDKDAKYVIVDTLKEDSDLESIIPEAEDSLN